MNWPLGSAADSLTIAYRYRYLIFKIIITIYDKRIAGHRHRRRCRRHRHSVTLYLSPVTEHSGTGLGPLIPVPEWFRQRQQLLIMFFIGTWLHQNGTDGCEPTSGDCYYDPEGENDQVRCRTNFNCFVVFALNTCHSVSAALGALGPNR